jgi:hypothetical protein
VLGARDEDLDGKTVLTSSSRETSGNSELCAREIRYRITRAVTTISATDAVAVSHEIVAARRMAETATNAAMNRRNRTSHRGAVTWSDSSKKGSDTTTNTPLINIIPAIIQ